MIIDCAVYQDGKRRPGEVALHEAYEAGHADNAFVWIGLYEPDEAEFDSVRREFDLHELAVEDAINAHQRPKLEVYDDTLFVVLKTARYVDTDDTVEFGEIMLFIGPQFVVAVQFHPEVDGPLLTGWWASSTPPPNYPIAEAVAGAARNQANATRLLEAFCRAAASPGTGPG